MCINDISATAFSFDVLNSVAPVKTKGKNKESERSIKPLEYKLAVLSAVERVAPDQVDGPIRIIVDK